MHTTRFMPARLSGQKRFLAARYQANLPLISDQQAGKVITYNFVRLTDALYLHGRMTI
jgi:hypothetical protein